MSLDFTAALDGARTLATVDDIAKALWSAHDGSGGLSDADAEAVGARIEEGPDPTFVSPEAK
jgi:hypothetical protein